MIISGDLELDFIWSKTTSCFEWEEGPGIANKPSIYLVENHWEEYSFWTPLEEKPYLFIEFAELKPDDNIFLEWANENGRLTHGKLLDFYAMFGEDGNKFLDEVGSDSWRLPVEKRTLWHEAHTELSRTYKIWKLLEDENKDVLGQYFGWERNEQNIPVEFVYYFSGKDSLKKRRKTPKTTLDRLLARQGMKKIISDTDTHWQKYRMFYPDIKTPARFYVESVIFAMINRYPVNLSLSFDEKTGAVKQKLRPSSLLSAMWLMFHLYIKGDIRIKRCEVCGKWENMEGHRANWTRHKSCGNNARVQEYRKKNIKK